MWYCARLLYQSLSDDQEARPGGETLFEEKVVVLRCKKTDGAEHIVNRVQALAKDAEEEYESIAGNRVKLVFREILEIQDITDPSIRDGTEVYFRYWHSPQARDFKIMRHAHGDRWWEDDSDRPDR
ncbi:MAG: DUF4288 domain-containing protein [Dehalococcoidia bacterium]